jgi:hypothetical protein
MIPCDNLVEDSRWPHFAAAALATGVHSGAKEAGVRRGRGSQVVLRLARSGDAPNIRMTTTTTQPPFPLPPGAVSTEEWQPLNSGHYRNFDGEIREVVAGTKYGAHAVAVYAHPSNAMTGPSSTTDQETPCSSLAPSPS